MRRRLFPPLLLLLPLLWLFRGALFDGHVFAFRDAAHFYFPLYEYVQLRWWQGLPLWNPLDGIGQPLMGDPTAAVWYPGKIVFLLPLSYATCFAVYIVSHLWLGGYGTYRLVRSLRTNWYGALIAGSCYELSGQILFQYTNPIYCVGAAWLPWGVLLLNRYWRSQGGRDAALLAAVLSLMILGGDPHVAYYVLLLGLVGLTVVWPRTSTRAILRPLMGMVVVVLAVGLLSATQILPTYQWTQRSDRALRDGPHSLWEWMSDATQRAGAADEPALASFWQRPPRGSHQARAYDFSVGPWRWPELLWPNVSGSPFPTHQRWLAAFPGTSRMWTPSLYLGVLPILLGAYRFRLLGGSPQTRTWSWVVMLAVLGAVGAFGFGWLGNELRYLMDRENYASPSILSGFGGLYWLLNLLLPGHANFRYPSKLWTLASLGIAVLAAKGWSGWMVRPQRMLASAKPLCLISWATAAICSLPWLHQVLADLPANRLFGPFDAVGAQASLVTTFLHTAVILSILVGVSLRPTRRRYSMAFVLLTVGELTWAQSALIQTVPTQGTQRTPSFQTIYRCPPVDAYPAAWREESSPDRFQQLQSNDLTTLMPKHHLTAGLRSLQSSVPMTCADYFLLAEVAREVGYGPGEPRTPHREWVNLLGAREMIVPRSSPLRAMSDRVSRQFPGSPVEQFYNASALPRAWLVHRWITLPALADPTRAEALRRTRRVLCDHRGIRDFRRLAVIETGESFPASATLPVSATSVCRVNSAEPERLTIDVRTGAPAVLVLADQYYPGWEVWVSSDGAVARRQPLLRVNRVMRGVHLVAGAHAVEFRYRPREVFVGMILSLMGWTGWLLYMCVQARFAHV